MILSEGEEEGMKFREVERLVLNDGWYLKSIKGSHHQYKHPTKPGKAIIPHNVVALNKNTIKSILLQAGL